MKSIGLVTALVALTGTAAADGAFMQGLVGYSKPVAGENYTEAAGSGSARVGARAGWTPLRFGRMQVGFDGGVDWRAIEVSGSTVQQLRALIGPRIAFVADRHSVFFRASAGYEWFEFQDDSNANGYAFEPGFGGTYRYEKLIFGAEVALPIMAHTEESSSMEGFAGVDLQVMLSAGAEL